jgi:transketolase
VTDHTPGSDTPLDARSRRLRRTIVGMLEAAGRGHLASAFSVVEILRALYDGVARYDPSDPCWPERDRVILSKGHGCLAQYVLLADKGFFAEEELCTFCSPTSFLGGHPEHGKVPGVECSTGSLGHGPSIGIGFALNARYEGRDSRVFVVTGDGETNEGSFWEALLAASKHRLSNFTILVDYNKQQSYSTTAEVLELEPYADKFRAFGFEVEEVDGHDVPALTKVLGRLPFAPDKPSAIICHTVKGKGVSFVERNLSYHHKSRPTPDEVEGMLAELADA